MIVQTGFKVNSGFDIEAPPDLRLYDVPDTHTVERLPNAVEREHIRQIIQQVTGCKFSNEHLDAMQQIAVRLVATFTKLTVGSLVIVSIILEVSAMILYGNINSMIMNLTSEVI